MYLWCNLVCTQYMYVGKKKVSKKHSCSFSRRIFVTGCALHAPYLPSKLILNKSMYLLALIAQYTETTDWTVEKCPKSVQIYPTFMLRTKVLWRTGSWVIGSSDWTWKVFQMFKPFDLVWLNNSSWFLMYLPLKKILVKFFGLQLIQLWWNAESQDCPRWGS